MRSWKVAGIGFLLAWSVAWSPQAPAGRKPSPPPDEPPPPEEPAPPSTAEPPARYWHAFSANEPAGVESRLYVFGGQGGPTGSPAMLGDFWHYRVDAGTWTPTPTGRSKPGKRDGVGLSCGAGQCVLANGRGAGMLKETWIYTEATASWSQINCTRYLCPSARGFPAAAYDPVRKQHVLFGGAPSNDIFYFDDTYTFAAGKWAARDVLIRPPSRATAAASFVGGPVDMIVMFGGAYYKGPDPVSGNYYWDARCDLWAWDGSKWLAIVMKNQGPCLAFPAMTWDPVAGELVVASGETLENGWERPNRDVWYFKFDTRTSGTWTKDGGSAFFSCASNASPLALMAYGAVGRKKVFFGGGENTAFGVASYANTTVCD